ncbi:MAG: lytic transglycosylase domain-containing protein [Pseudomonadota bacterium]
MWRVLALVSGLAASLAWAAPDGRTEISAICDSAARLASQSSGVPVDVLRALTRTETGRKMAGRLRPWPWTVNMEGAGFWFDTREEALEFALRHHARGARSFDVGCFQINYRWHGEAFESIEMMFDPQKNAEYAAKFIGDLHRESGQWAIAAGHYHSRTPSLSKKYRDRFNRIRTALGPAPDAVPMPVVVETSPNPSRRLAGLVPHRSRGASASGLAPAISGPQHARTPGSVRLSAFSDGSGLLAPGRPLFD